MHEFIRILIRHLATRFYFFVRKENINLMPLTLLKSKFSFQNFKIFFRKIDRRKNFFNLERNTRFIKIYYGINRVSESSQGSQLPPLPLASLQDQIILLMAVQPHGLVNLINDALAWVRLVSGSIAAVEKFREISDDTTSSFLSKNEMPGPRFLIFSLNKTRVSSFFPTIHRSMPFG